MMASSSKPRKLVPRLRVELGKAFVAGAKARGAEKRAVARAKYLLKSDAIDGEAVPPEATSASAIPETGVFSGSDREYAYSDPAQ